MIILIIFFIINKSLSTIDLNLPELMYLSDHLLPEECRKLVAAAHFKSYEEPKALDQAERTIPKDIPCLKLLLHWNSADGEGKGETHEVLENRLRQMGKHELADWLGKTVFRQLGQDLEKSLNTSWEIETLKRHKQLQGIMQPVVKEPLELPEWLTFDTIIYFVVFGLISSIIILCLVLLIRLIKYKREPWKKSSYNYYELIGNHLSDNDDGDDESEEKFNIRSHS